MAFFPGETDQEFVTSRVFDFDGALFADLWHSHSRADFEADVRYHLSDHRPLCAQFRMAERRRPPFPSGPAADERQSTRHGLRQDAGG